MITTCGANERTRTWFAALSIQLDSVRSFQLVDLMGSKTKAKKSQIKSIPVKRPFEEAIVDDIDEEELALTIETLEALARTPTILTGKRFRPLKSAIHNYLRGSSSLVQGSLVNRISDALTDARWLDARVLLAEFRIRRETVKLGTLQRWVREVDAAAASNLGLSVSAEVFLTLGSILRATAQAGTQMDRPSSPPHVIGANHSIGHTSDGLKDANESHVIEFTPTVSFKAVSGVKIYDSVSDHSIFHEHPRQECKDNAKIVEITPASERKPPNQYDATIYTTIKPILQESAPSSKCRHDVTNVPGAFVIEDLLSMEECQAIIRQGEAVGFSPDCAIAGSATQQASILAHNFYYFADDHTLDQIYSRALPYLPQTIEGCRVRGINARFRVYRYVPGAVYRPHIDGSWPRSGLDLARPEGTQYLYNDTRDGAQLSRLTFLIYLNDDFEEGYTTFFLPCQDSEKLKGVRVEPRIGSVLVFPHGESIGALLHEGSAVTKGAKYVIRTDVLYDKSEIKK